MANKLFRLRRISLLLRPGCSSLSSVHRSHVSSRFIQDGSESSCLSPNIYVTSSYQSSRSLCSVSGDLQGPAVIDYHSQLDEDEFHKLADLTIDDLQEKFEEYADSVQVDGFDIDYGNQVLTVKLGNLGTYVLNKQTPNRQLWLSSPVSGPARFDWDRSAEAWVYRRNKANLLKLLESELEKLCGVPINLA